MTEPSNKIKTFLKEFGFAVFAIGWLVIVMVCLVAKCLDEVLS